MERDPNLLKQEFLSPLAEAVRAVSERGFVVKPFCTRRDPWSQARLWRQSRTLREIRAAVETLQGSGANFIARILHEVGPQHGRWATNALPGLSWHQWLEACDFFVLQDGRAIWTADHPGYQILHAETINRGLFVPLPRTDPYHIQMRGDSIRQHWGWPEIDEFMKSWYDNQA